MHARRVNALLCIRILIFPLAGNQVSGSGEKFMAGSNAFILPANYALSTTEGGGEDFLWGLEREENCIEARLKLPTRLTYLGAGCLRGACRDRV